MALNPLLGLFCPGSLILFSAVARPWTPPLLMFCCVSAKLWGCRERACDYLLHILPTNTEREHIPMQMRNCHVCLCVESCCKLWHLYLFHWCSLNITEDSHGTTCQESKTSGKRVEDGAGDKAKPCTMENDSIFTRAQSCPDSFCLIRWWIDGGPPSLLMVQRGKTTPDYSGKHRSIKHGSVIGEKHCCLEREHCCVHIAQKLFHSILYN